jgi:hypothetical protein
LVALAVGLERILEFPFRTGYAFHGQRAGKLVVAEGLGRAATTE